MTHIHASIEPLDVIEADECAQHELDLTARRFRRLFNEIEILRAALSAVTANEEPEAP